jgi:predicted DNA-binding transcriptional regulator YafY
LKTFGVTAGIFAERQFHPSQKIISIQKSKQKKIETLEIEMRVAAGRGLERFILSWLPEIEVVTPASIRSDIEKIITGSRR